MSRTRFVVECTWSGYHARQARVCHRVVTRHPAQFHEIDGVEFTDGTHMTVQVRECTPRERVAEIHGYDRLFNKIWSQGLTGWVRVADLK